MHKRVANLSRAECSYISEKRTLCNKKMHKHEMLKDACGQYWCPEHRYRGELLNWAAQHGYPAIQFRGKMCYAIGLHGCSENKMFWQESVLLGNEDMVRAALDHVGLRPESEQAS